jgi:hypothetical protein
VLCTHKTYVNDVTANHMIMQEVYRGKKYTVAKKQEVILAKKLYFISLLGTPKSNI